MSGLRSRNKGKAGERELARLLRDELGEQITRNLVQTRDGGRDLIGLPGISLEVKRCERTEWPKWLEQAKAQSADGEYPVVAWRRNGKPWRVFVEMDLAQFCEFARERMQ